MNREDVINSRVNSIFNFCSKLHDDIDELYEVMVDGTDDEERLKIEYIISKLNELNLDRQ